jgi:cytochrome c-type biogenesis protein CcmE
MSPEEVSEEHIESLPDADGEGVNWHIVLILMAFVGFGTWIIFDGVDSGTYFFPVDKAVAKTDQLIGERVRLKGKVLKGSVRENDSQMGRTFEIAENGKSVRVIYHKALPDTFQPGIKVVAEGRFQKDRVLDADQVTVKCPSRYEGKPPTDMPENHEVKREQS